MVNHTQTDKWNLTLELSGLAVAVIYRSGPHLTDEFCVTDTAFNIIVE